MYFATFSYHYMCMPKIWIVCDIFWNCPGCWIHKPRRITLSSDKRTDDKLLIKTCLLWFCFQTLKTTSIICREIRTKYSAKHTKKTSDGLCTIRHVVYKRNTRRSDLNAWPFYEVTWWRHVISQNSHCVLTFFREWPVMTYWIDIEIPGMNCGYSDFPEAHFLCTCILWSCSRNKRIDVWNVKLYQYRIAESRKR